MTPNLAGKNIAILVASGFDENQMTEIQRGLVRAKARSHTIAPENGVVNGWQGEGWGHHFAVDAQIGEALGSDFDMLVLPGGDRGIAKLKTNLHTRRIINHFMEAGKPVAAIGVGVSLLALSGKIVERIVTAHESVHGELKAAGAEISAEPEILDGNLLTSNGEDIAIWVEDVLTFFADADMERVAA
ncbi:MAG: DJ-1/PfpI family protein [Alphaproteobacteria bacterium]|nr:DJ-1/PfpI family protein [Alphaproteobacteria bacterium]